MKLCLWDLWVNELSVTEESVWYSLPRSPRAFNTCRSEDVLSGSAQTFLLPTATDVPSG